jgi:putative transposase
VVNGMMYITKTGAQWRLPPREFPPWQTVYDHYQRWNHRGVWEQALDALNQAHQKNDRNLTPSYGIVSRVQQQSVQGQAECPGSGLAKLHLIHRPVQFVPLS